MGKREISVLMRTLAVYGLVLAVAAPQPNAQVTYRTVALSGKKAAGLDGNIEYDLVFFGASAINDAGQAVLIARLAGPGVSETNDEALFGEVADVGLVAIVREGDQAPGLAAGVNYASLSLSGLEVVFNNAGQVAFRTLLTGAGVDPTNNFAIFRGDGDSGVTMIARTGNQAPGLPTGVNYAGFANDQIVLNDSGQMMFRASFNGAGINFLNNDGFFGDVGGAGLEMIIREGDQAPGLPAGINYNFVGGFPPIPLLNNLGQTAFSISWIEEGADAPSFAILSDVGGAGLVPIFHESNQGVGLPTGISYSGYHPVLNDASEMAFIANLAGAGVIENVNDQAIFSDVGSAGPTLIARRGDQAPGFPAGFVYSSSWTSTRLVLNNAGQIAFLSFVQGTGINSTNHQTIFSDIAGSEITAIASQGDQATGFPIGTTYKGFNMPLLNDAGQMVFHALLVDTTAEPCDPAEDLDCDPFCSFAPLYCLPERYAIYATDALGEAHLVLADGMLLDVNDDPLIEDFREISFLFIGDSALNNNAELVFHAAFTDGTSGVFVATLPALCPLELADGDTIEESVMGYLLNTRIPEPGPVDAFDFFDVLPRLEQIEAGCP